MSRRRKRKRDAAPAVREPFTINLRGFVVLMLTAGILGPLNFTLSLVLPFLVWSLIESDLGRAAAPSAPVVIITQAITAALIIGLARFAVGRWSGLPIGWGYLLGVTIAAVTNAAVLSSLPIF